jgi:hypothetical protein
MRGQMQRGVRKFRPDKRHVKFYVEAGLHHRSACSVSGALLANLYLAKTFPKDETASVSTSMTIPAMHDRRGMTAMLQDAVNPTDRPMQRTRIAGIAIAAATVISTIFVALDHSGGGSNPLEILQGIARLQPLKEVVHAVAIASVCAFAFGYATLARRLGLRQPLVLLGLSTYLIGCVAMVGATITDGFIVTHIAVDAVHAAPERVAFAYNLIHYAGVALNDMAKLGWILQAVGTLAWSIALVREHGFSRVAGVVGMLSSMLVVTLIVGSATNMSMTSLLSVLLAQLIWNFAAAALLLRDPVSVDAAARQERVISRVDGLS